MPRPRIRWNSERLLSLSAMSISFITLVIFIYQTNLMSRQNYLSILPYLALTTTHDNANHTFNLDLKNHGVGPAIIESVTFIYDDKRYDLADYEGNLYFFLKSIAPALDSLRVVSYAALDRGMAIPANQFYTALSVQNSPRDYELMTGQLNRLLAGGLQYEVVYKSIQEERWRINNDSEGPEKLR